MFPLIALMSGRLEPMSGRIQPMDGLTPSGSGRYSACSDRAPPHASRTLMARARRVPVWVDAALRGGSSLRARRRRLLGRQRTGPFESYRGIRRSGPACALRHLPLDARDERRRSGRRRHAGRARRRDSATGPVDRSRADRCIRPAVLTRSSGRTLDPAFSIA